MKVTKLTHNQIVSHAFAISSVTQKVTKDGKPYVVAMLSHPTGQVKGMVFSEAIPRANLKENKIFQIEGKAQHFQGTVSIVVDRASEQEEESVADYVPDVPTLVFDIETVGEDYSKLAKADQKYLLESLEKDKPPKEAKERTGLYPLYGFVAFVGMMNPTSGKGKVLGLTKKAFKPEDKNFDYEKCKDEAGILNRFWEIASGYEQFVTFNGKRFDVPFLIFRSLINKVKVLTDINKTGRHIDLAQSISPYGVRMFRLEAICRALGISDPKEKGVSGLHVAKLYKGKKYKDIVDYVARDAVSTAELYKRWREIAPLI